MTMNDTPRSMKELAQEALDVQNAYNLCGVAQSFARMMIDLGPHTNGTDERNTHPLVRLYLDKMTSLAGEAQAQDWAFAHDQIGKPEPACSLPLTVPENITIRDPEHFTRTAAQAAKDGQLERLENVVQYLSQYATHDGRKTRVDLYPDFEPQSFTANITDADTGKQIIYLGVIYYGNDWHTHS